MAESSAEIAVDSIVVAATHQVSVDLGEEVLILHLSTAGYYSLRRVAARIWEMLEDPIRVSEIGAALARQYGIPRDRCEADVMDLLADLAERGLVEVVR